MKRFAMVWMILAMATPAIAEKPVNGPAEVVVVEQPVQVDVLNPAGCSCEFIVWEYQVYFNRYGNSLSEYRQDFLNTIARMAADGFELFKVYDTSWPNSAILPGERWMVFRRPAL